MVNKLYTKKSLLTICISCAFSSSLSYADVSKKNLESIETIVVMGEKTHRSLKDTASSVAVIDESQLQDLTHLSLSSAVAEIANVVVLPGAKPDIRGVSGNGSASGFNGVSGGAKARVSTLIDGISEPFMADLTGDTGMWDIEQIEVLRGPQSTSHGKNSIGGTMFIKTKDPSFDWQGAGRVAYRNQDRYVDTSVMASGPLIDNELAFRVTVQRVDGDDYDNSVEYDSNPARFDLNELNTQKTRFKLLWQPSQYSGFKALLSHAVSKEKGNTGRTYYIADDPWAFVPVWERYMNTDSHTTSLKLNYQLNNKLDYEVLMSTMDYDWGFDSYEANPARDQVMKMSEDNSSVDLKLNYTDNTVSGFVGLAYFDREQNYHSESSFSYFGDDSSESKSIYGELSYRPYSPFTVTVGGRIEKESQQRSFNRQVKQELSKSDLDRDKTIRLPKFVLQYHINENSTASISARRGYNSGGGALIWETGEYYYYDSETVNTYELGIRSAINKDINLSANVFYNNYSNYQAVGVLRKISNMDKVITYGTEFELSAMLTNDLQIKTGLGLLRSEIKDNSVQYAAYNCKELSSAPGYTANVALTYWVTDQLNMRFSTVKVDEYFTEIGNTQERVAGNYTISRIQAEYEIDNWLFSAFINNVFDEKAFNYVEPAGRHYEHGYVGVIDPKNMGASITYRY
ncbi:TonB-dependent receptor [Pseudoalteromonas sp. S16_S37]|uniref:TonB-dependent receptor n=1 Tax=Pseudoalteromonas sp. S16_S37 TaxID=2720228 RepID=UPI001681BB83|nr:TonB-dependent receptor plug domain-containing protein [Pseudoalteromonas sp. S16_S37]MBD1583725.1 TonB-dependent receptor plug domain-containing protein [Pseudoalteromonas sp. S16_S37]